MKMTKLYVETRINALRRDPVGNAKLIKKWVRLLRRLEKEETN